MQEVARRGPSDSQTARAAAPSLAGGLRALVVAPGGAATAFDLLQKECTIGRGQECRVRIDDPKVSRLHADITRDPHGRYLLTDLSSHNGTVVDGRQLVGALVLRGGEAVRLGQSRFEIRFQRPGKDT